MHRIIKAHLDSFVVSHALEAESEASQFEKFVNFSVISAKLGSRFDLDDITTCEGDDGTDGVAILVDEEIIVSKEEATSVFSTDRRNHDVETLFIQAKRSESFDLGGFLKFKESILRFINSDQYTSNDDIQISTREVFEENVRSFLGLENPVNASIEFTIQSNLDSSRFPVLNNGITIASPDVRVQGNSLYLENFQIVNGCQTSNVLYENREFLDDSIMVSLKIVETLNEDVFSELVRATNSQKKVEETQFISLRPIVKKIEPYCKSIIDSFSRYGDSVIEPFSKSVDAIVSLGDITNDRLKRQAILQEMYNKIN